ncbi:S-adenosyl-L-methionine-dependent methyltransferase [Xylaria nigripes]|nr:S-adenosyl-L-methionine-dependent methyltransferase [Xylaria nigripes]
MASPPGQSPDGSPSQAKPAAATVPADTTRSTSDSPSARGNTAEPSTSTSAESQPSSASSSSSAAEASTPAPIIAAAQSTINPVTIPDSGAPAPHGLLPASHWAQVPQPDEDEFDDDDSAYGDDNASSTASLSASILEYRTMHGRTYHSERGNAQSWGPNDAQHDESLDIIHHAATLIQDGKLTLAAIPKDRPIKVLDVGSGSGLWAIDFADEYPLAEVIGVDISPSQPQWIPPNLRFEVDDITLPWTYPPNSFDYIHMRWLVGAIPNWYSVIEEVFKALKPGGIFESVESSCMIQSDDGTVQPGSALHQWGEVFQEAGKKFGRTFTPVEEELPRKGMVAAGFTDVKVHNFKMILGPWPADPKWKEVGMYARLSLEQDIEGFLLYMWTKVLGWTKEEISVYAAHLRRELHNPNFHSYYPQCIVIGHKPL